jgi:hypothetical protein
MTHPRMGCQGSQWSGICTSPKGSVAWGHVMGIWRSPSTYPMFNCKFITMGGRINAPDLSSFPIISMELLVPLGIHLCAQAAEAYPVQQSSSPAPRRWHNPLLVCSLHPVFLSLLVRCHKLVMPRYRPRGKPKRGSPWKPRRPLVPSSDSTSGDSSPPRHATTIPVSLRAPQPRSLAIIPRAPISILHLSRDTAELPSSSMPPGETQDNWGDPSHHTAPGRAGPCYPENIDRIQFAESLAILQDLVFELRQEVADLKYRFHATEGKVASFMHILSSMHEALFSAPEDTRPTEHPEDTTEAAQTDAQISEAAGGQQKERWDDSKDLANTSEAAEPWDYGVTFIEEEPYPGDLPAT